MEKLKQSWKKIPAPVRKIGVFVVGFLVIIIGIVLLALPGPGWAIIFVGLAILATEFATAARIKQKIIARFKNAANQLKRSIGRKK